MFSKEVQPSRDVKKLHKVLDSIPRNYRIPVDAPVKEISDKVKTSNDFVAWLNLAYGNTPCIKRLTELYGTENITWYFCFGTLYQPFGVECLATSHELPHKQECIAALHQYVSGKETILPTALTCLHIATVVRALGDPWMFTRVPVAEFIKVVIIDNGLAHRDENPRTRVQGFA